MTAVALLLVLLINLVFTCVLIAGLYYLSIYQLEKKIQSLAEKLSQTTAQKQMPFMPVRSPEGLLPDLDDIPEEAFYGEEEQDYITRPEDVEEALTERQYTNYNRPNVSAVAQLKALNSDGA
jgi:hypothetical protein